MKLIYSIFFLLILSCSTVKKEYVCGDHPCINKKEFNEYFSDNLIVEIKSQKNTKNKKVDLFKLNEKFFEKKINNDKNSKKNKLIKEKERRKNLKAEKKILLKKKKAEEVKKKNKQINGIKKNKILKPEISNNREVKKVINKSAVVNRDKLIKNSKKNESFQLSKDNNPRNICDDIKDCDITKIAEMLIKKGKDKPFPNITSN